MTTTFDDDYSGNLEGMVELTADQSGGHGVVHGGPGVGKTSCALTVCSGEGATGILVDCEDGARHYKNVRRIVPKTFQELMELFLKFGQSTNPRHKYLVVDTVGSMAGSLIFPGICNQHNVSSIGEAPFGRGLAATESFARRYCDAADFVAQNGKWVISICHSKLVSINDPSIGQPYDRHGLKLPQQMADVLLERCDFCAFASTAITTRQTQGGKSVAIGIGGGAGDRTLRFHPIPSVLAKTRCGHPETAPLCWESFGI